MLRKGEELTEKQILCETFTVLPMCTKMPHMLKNPLDIFHSVGIIMKTTKHTLIKSGGGIGPMKPGNLLFKVPNPTV